MHMIVIGNKDIHLTEWLLEKLNRTIDFCSHFFVITPQDHVRVASKQSIDEAILQLAVSQFASKDKGIFLLPIQIKQSLLPRKAAHKINPQKILTGVYQKNYHVRSYKRSPHGGLALVRREERASRPNRKPRRNGSR